MGYYYNTLSSSTIKFVTITMVLIALGQYSTLASECDTTTPVPTSGECSGFYGYCAVNVITALRDTTPNSENYSFSRSYPRDGAVGGVTGTATCVVANGLGMCEACLVAAHSYLSSCSTSASGSYSTDDCTMNFSPIS